MQLANLGLSHPHNVGASHVARSRRLAARLEDLETAEARISSVDGESEVVRRFSATVILSLIYRLKPVNRLVILLYLEGEGAGSIAEVTGFSASNVATKIHPNKQNAETEIPGRSRRIPGRLALATALSRAAATDDALFSDSQMTTNVLGGENPRRMTLVPLQIVASQPSASAIQNEILSECELQPLDAEPDI